MPDPAYADHRLAPAVVVAAVLTAEADRPCGAPGCDRRTALVLGLAVVGDCVLDDEPPTLPFCWTCWQDIGLPNLWLKPAVEGSDTSE